MKAALPLLVIGVGQRLRGADAAGREVLERLAGLLPPDCAAQGCDGDALDLIEAWRGAAAVILVDAMISGARPGHLMRFDASTTPLPYPGRPASTHAMGVADAIELARAMRCLPDRVIVYAIEGDDFTPGSPLSPAMQRGIECAVGSITREAGALLSLRTRASPIRRQLRGPDSRNATRNDASGRQALPLPPAWDTASTKGRPDGAATSGRGAGDEDTP